VTSIGLNIQDPSAPTGHLLEALLKACEGARGGGGLFAFATADGVRLLFRNRAFAGFLSDSEQFKLIVGVDAITNVAALDAIEAITAPALEARVFVHDRRPVLFHPKLTWFRNDGGMTLVTGSGNLTPGGLRSNWEAFSVLRVGRPHAARLQREIDKWLARWSEFLLPLSDPRVRERAERNTGRERDLQVPAPRRESRRLERQESQTYEPADAVLVAEISKAGSRPTQANFHLEQWEGYFGARRGEKRTIVLRQVQADGALDEPYASESVEVASHNYRFELAPAFAGQEYPNVGRPIGVFVRTAAGIFLCRLLFPGESGHDEMTAFLDTRAPSRARMGQERATVDELRAAWPDSPLLRAIPPA
jgi:hypothetical protein